MQHLTEPEIQQTYELLGKLYVPLEEAKIMQGLTYIRERLTICRAAMDQVHDLRLKTARASSWVQEQLIFRKSQLLLAASDQEKKQLRVQIAELEQQKISHVMLFRMVSAHSTVLNQTQRDIKTLGEVVKEQLKLGEAGGVDPHEAEEALMTPVDLASVGTAPATPHGAPDPLEPDADEPEPEDPEEEADEPVEEIKEPDLFPLPEGEPFPLPDDPPRPLAMFATPVPGLDELADLFAPMSERKAASVSTVPSPATTEVTTAPPATRSETVGFDTPLTVVESAPRGVPVADMSSVPIESLFEEMTTHGGTPTPSYRAF
jgi:hypothetical protein